MITKEEWEIKLENLYRIAEKTPNCSKERQTYNECLKHYRDYYNTINTAEIRGHVEGHAKGLAEGLEKGEKIGIEKERIKAYKEKLKSAKKMKEKGMTNEQIILFLDISKDEIEKL
ncbi:MAG: hypothetical protein MJ211_11805 [Bacteroidales bacterium]|nr:hypothetical protein [Bacteroidales bacterium]